MADLKTAAINDLAPLELRAQRRSSMLAVPERLSLSFARGNIEMRAKPNGTGGTSFRFEGYFRDLFNDPFTMWDMWGEGVRRGGRAGFFQHAGQTSATPRLWIGHYDALRDFLMAQDQVGGR